ncbi:TonB-dependent receptor plug domain-containing protein, partial [Pseudomonas viridiflava]|uniref:TonB-dependent receptor plug domain-containing protein n=1 Tax=Pseudomonas viridiflava TaxID=33069 RepID=UPI0013D69F8D
MSGQQLQSRFRFTPCLLDIGIGIATSQVVFAAETQPAQATGTLELGATEISDDRLGTTTEGSGSYTTGVMQTATKLPLSMRETPQAVTVITRQRMDDQAMTSVNDVVRNTPGLFLSQANGPGRKTYTSRGFDIHNIMYDGIPASYSGFTAGVQPNLAMFDRVEVIRAATAPITGAGHPSAAL